MVRHRRHPGDRPRGASLKTEEEAPGGATVETEEEAPGGATVETEEEANTAEEGESGREKKGEGGREKKGPPRCRIGVAWDEAFHFYYEDNLARLEGLGAELVRFSPMRDARPPEVDGMYFGGGYPELHAEALERNEGMRARVLAFARAGGAVYAECGGLMYLCAGIRTREGARHAMAGVIPAEAVMEEKLQAIGYVEVETLRPSVLGPAGLRFRGHQFRHSRLDPAPGGEARGQGGSARGQDWMDPLYRLRSPLGGPDGEEGYQEGNVLASYVHGHWASNPAVAEGFVRACASARAPAAREAAPAAGEDKSA
ncbi:MAG: hypothetical protein V3V62_03610 [bacterium]